MALLHLSGRLICADAVEVEALRAHLPAHIRLSRAEAGCIRFDVTTTDDPLIWQVEESCADRAAFEAHQARTRASDWWAATQAIRRDYRITGG